MRIVILIAAAVLAAVSAWAEPFGSGPEDTWSVREADGLCLLEQPVPDFGAVRFVGAPGLAVRLEVLGHRDMFAAGPVGVFRVAPPWSPSHPNRVLLGSSEQRAGSSLLIPDPLATQVLMSLYEGFEAHLKHAAWYGGQADIRIGNAHLRSRYGEFARCLRGATADGWSSYERTRIEYAESATGLGERDRKRLRRVAEYVLADPQVTAVYVDGHTDDLGAAQGNLALSRKRAEVVAGYLAQCGVPRSTLVVRYHGDKYPVVRPDGDAARAENRRTTVRLERALPDVARR